MDAWLQEKAGLRPLAVVPTLPTIYTHVRKKLLCARRDGYRDFCAILLLHRDFPSEAVTRALEEAVKRGLYSADAVRQMLLNERDHAPAPVAVPAVLAQVTVQAVDPGRYDHLLLGRGCPR